MARNTTIKDRQPPQRRRGFQLRSPRCSRLIYDHYLRPVDGVFPALIHRSLEFADKEDASNSALASASSQSIPGESRGDGPATGRRESQ